MRSVNMEKGWYNHEHYVHWQTGHRLRRHEADGGKEASCTITVKEKASGSEGGSDDTGDMKVEIKF